MRRFAKSLAASRALSAAACASAAAARARLGLAPEGPLVAVLPGSRPDEVRYLGTTFVAAIAVAALSLPAWAQTKTKVAAIYTVPVEQQWVSRIDKALNALPGVEATVNLASERARIRYTPGLADPALLLAWPALPQAVLDAAVIVVAPDHNWSASGHTKTMHKPLRVNQTTLRDGSAAFETDGAPTDCAAR